MWSATTSLARGGNVAPRSEHKSEALVETSDGLSEKDLSILRATPIREGPSQMRLLHTEFHVTNTITTTAHSVPNVGAAGKLPKSGNGFGEKVVAQESHGTDPHLYQRNGAARDGVHAPWTEDGIAVQSRDVLQSGRRRNILNIADSSVQLPSVMDGMLESALQSFDRVAGGLLSGFATSNIDFARTEDDTRLIVRVHLPDDHSPDSQAPGPRIVHAAVVGRSHLRIGVEVRTGEFLSSSSHTIALPARVSTEDVEIDPKQDGTVHISLRILKDKLSGGEELRDSFAHTELRPSSFFKLPIGSTLFPALFHSAKDPEVIDTPDTRYEVPSAVGVKECRGKHEGEKLLFKKCICDVIDNKESRAVCYGSLISKSVSMARRLGMDDFATAAKHDAIECASGEDDKCTCLEKVASTVLKSMYSRNSGDGRLDVSDRIRQAIESEDDGPSNFRPVPNTWLDSTLAYVALSFLLIAVVLACWCRRRLFGHMEASSPHRLTSVLTQRLSGQGFQDRRANRGLSTHPAGVRQVLTQKDNAPGLNSKSA